MGKRQETEEVNCNQREVILGLAEMVQGMRKLETIRSQEACLTSLSQKLFLTRSFHSLKLSVSSGLWNKMTKGKPSSVNSSTISKRKEDETKKSLEVCGRMVAGQIFRCHLKDQTRPCKDWRCTRLMIIFTCRRYFASVNLSYHPYAQHHSYFRVFPGAHLSGT